MKRIKALTFGCFAAPLLQIAPAQAQFTTPNVIATTGATASTLGSTTFVNQGLVGVGRISASALDSFGETFGSASGLQITDWGGDGESGYTGTFQILPDRGYNNNNAGGFFSHYAARIQSVDFAFVPYVGPTNVGGDDLSSKIAAQNQITFTSPIRGRKFTYFDTNAGIALPTTGLDPASSSATLFGNPMPYVTSYTGQRTPGASNETFVGINRLALDSEALALKPDGSGYVGDEYGAHIYYFNANKEIVGAIVPPPAMQPHLPVGVLNFQSTATPTDGRRNNQGLEGVALSPDGNTLFALLQSATRQDSDAANNQNARHTRLLIYDVSGSTTPASPIAAHALTLPTLKLNGNGGAVDRTAAQSELVALDDHRLLVLARDGNGLGSNATNPSMYKSVLLVDTQLGNPTNFVNDVASTTVAGKITSASGVLSPGIVPLAWTEVVNILNGAQLGKFNVELDSGGQVSKLTLGEKWEGMSLVPANDPVHPYDHFLFVANDNDFLTSAGTMVGPDGTNVAYNAFVSHPATRIPPAVGDATDPTNNENDTMFLVYRVTVVPEPGVMASLGAGAIGLAMAVSRLRRAGGRDH
ncbi:MAG: esterase-like activity of phytase family protein [Myxococcota bacterium]